MKCFQQQDCNIPYRINTVHYSYLKAAGLDGAYDLKVMQSFLLKNVSVENEMNFFKIQTTDITAMGKPGLSALVLDGYSLYTLGNISLFSKYTNDDFFNMTY